MADVQQNPGSRKGASGRQRKRNTRIDMTAMVDVAFLLLTFFILTTTLAAPHALQTVLPDDGKDVEIRCNKMLEIYPGAEGKVYWYAGCDRATISTTGFGEAGIRKVIREQLEANPELVITLKPTATAPYSSLVDILDEMKITGAPRYALAALAPADEEMLDSKDLK